MSNLHAKRRLAASLAVGGLAAGGAFAASAGASPPAGHAHRAASSPFTVVATNLDNPRQMSFGPDGALYVAEAGHGGKGACVTDPRSGDKMCVGLTGKVLRIKGRSHGLVARGLPSVAGTNGQQAAGPASVIVNRGDLVIPVQDTNIDKNGRNPFGLLGRNLGKLVRQQLHGHHRRTAGPDFARFEAAHNPDRGAGTTPGGAIDSDPYDVVAYRGGFVVADAAANDLLQVDRRGHIHVLAVFPVQIETAPPGVAGPKATTLPVQSVPTSVVVGPDGALYVSELTGFPFQPGHARIWKVRPGHRTTLFARGFTNITSMAFDRHRRLLLTEIDQAGLLDNGKTSGAVIRISGRHVTTLLGHDLPFATGIAVSRSGGIYVSINGVFPGSGPGPHGAVVRLNAR